ncbi:MAG: hypothetical protein HRT35_31725 [Algicola sp.]|nr:hypothetical protein [Algicola sp.]
MKSSDTFAVENMRRNAVKSTVNNTAINTLSRTAKKRLTLALMFSIPLFVTSGAAKQFDNTHCTASAQTSCIAKFNTGNSANNSWLNWLSGGSRSTQFQFIDLFELVHSSKYQPTKTVVTTREG